MHPNPIEFTPIPSVARYKEAFRKIQPKLTRGHKAMLKAQYTAPQHTLTAGLLAMSAGYKNFNGANLQYGKIGIMLREALNYWSDNGIASSVLSYFIAPNRANGGKWLFVLHREVVQALRELGWFS